MTDLYIDTYNNTKLYQLLGLLGEVNVPRGNNKWQEHSETETGIRWETKGWFLVSNAKTFYVKVLGGDPNTPLNKMADEIADQLDAIKKSWNQKCENAVYISRDPKKSVGQTQTVYRNGDQLFAAQKINGKWYRYPYYKTNSNGVQIVNPDYLISESDVQYIATNGQSEAISVDGLQAYVDVLRAEQDLVRPAQVKDVGEVYGLNEKEFIEKKLKEGLKVGGPLYDFLDNCQGSILYMSGDASHNNWIPILVGKSKESTGLSYNNNFQNFGDSIIGSFTNGLVDSINMGNEVLSDALNTIETILANTNEKAKELFKSFSAEIKKGMGTDKVYENGLNELVRFKGCSIDGGDYSITGFALDTDGVNAIRIIVAFIAANAIGIQIPGKVDNTTNIINNMPYLIKGVHKIVTTMTNASGIITCIPPHHWSNPVPNSDSLKLVDIPGTFKLQVMPGVVVSELVVNSISYNFNNVRVLGESGSEAYPVYGTFTVSLKSARRLFHDDYNSWMRNKLGPIDISDSEYKSFRNGATS